MAKHLPDKKKPHTRGRRAKKQNINCKSNTIHLPPTNQAISLDDELAHFFHQTGSFRIGCDEERMRFAWVVQAMGRLGKRRRKSMLLEGHRLGIIPEGVTQHAFDYFRLSGV